MCWALTCLQSHIHSLMEVLEKVLRAHYALFYRKTLMQFSNLQHWQIHRLLLSMAWQFYSWQNLLEQIPLVNSYKNISTSSVPPSFLATVCKSTWSLTNTEQLHERRASAKGNIHWPENANQRSCHSSTKTMGKVSCKSKKKVWL